MKIPIILVLSIIMMFTVSVLTIKAGDSVTWTNKDISYYYR